MPPSVDRPSQPIGRYDTRADVPNVNAVWRSPEGRNATIARIGVFNPATGGVISQRTSSVNVAPNGTINVNWAWAWQDLTPAGFPFMEGTAYEVAVAARDTAGVWSDWSPKRAMSINARPYVPILYSPSNGSVSSGLFYLIVLAEDPDNTSASLSVEAEIYDADTDELLGVVPMTYESGTQHRVLPSSLVSDYRTYKWRARSYDGVLYGAWSGFRIFAREQVPTVTLTAPAGPTVSTATPTFTWDSPNQTAWWLTGYDMSTNRELYTTGIVHDTAQTFTIGTVENWLNGERWNNGEQIQWTLRVREDGVLFGGAVRMLTLSYSPATTLANLQIAAMAFTDIPGTHYIEGSFDASTYGADFIRYEVDRIELDGPGGNELPGTLIRNRFTSGNINETVFTDYDVTSNRWYRYSVRQIVMAGVDEIESKSAVGEAMCSWHGTLLHMPFDPPGNHVWLQYGTRDGYRPTRRREAMAMNAVHPSGYEAPLGFYGSDRRNDPSGEYNLIASGTRSHIAQLDTLIRLYKSQFADKSPDGRPHIMCWREGRGGDDGRLYLALREMEDAAELFIGTQNVILTFEQRHYSLGSGMGGV